MATTTLRKIAFRVLLDNGTDAQGNVKTVGISFPALSNSGYDAAKALAIANALEGCLTKSIYSCEQVNTSSVTE